MSFAVKNSHGFHFPLKVHISKWRLIPLRQDAIVHRIQRHQALTYGPYRIPQHKNPSVNTKSNRYLQKCNEETSLRQPVVATVWNTFGHGDWRVDEVPRQPRPQGLLAFQYARPWGRGWSPEVTHTSYVKRSPFLAPHTRATAESKSQSGSRRLSPNFVAIQIVQKTD